MNSGSVLTAAAAVAAADPSRGDGGPPHVRFPSANVDPRRELFVDCSVEYELPNVPKVTVDDGRRLLIIHPAYCQPASRRSSVDSFRQANPFVPSSQHPQRTTPSRMTASFFCRCSRCQRQAHLQAHQRPAAAAANEVMEVAYAASQRRLGYTTATASLGATAATTTAVPRPMLAPTTEAICGRKGEM
jgi:hypothetical protein